MVSFRDSPEEAAFRQEVRQFIEERVPSELKGQTRFGERGGPAFEAAQERWKAALKERGWHAAHWPREYGGAGLSTIEQFIFKEEMARQRVIMPFSVAISHAGPTIMLHGSEEQKREFLPKILAGEHSWCQGFSEPGAGSDLASLQTRAVLDGDDYVVNGQKIWTSYAHESDWMILLARTDPDAPKHKGISYFLVDLQTPGLTVRPLVDMGGQAGFNEVFFDNVHVPKKNLLGEENRGWYIATTTLDLERSGVATAVNQALLVEDLAALARETAGEAPIKTSIRYELAERRIEAEIGQLLSYVVISEQKRGRVPNRESATAKLYTSELEQRIAGTTMRLLGLHSLIVEGPAAVRGGAHGRFYLTAVASTIGGGTSEIMRNVIAMRGLGLPRS
jgi:alkylation response protein AidB-like acyl-CoA dehydrogenase